MPIIRAMRLLNTIENGSMTSAQLQTLLTTNTSSLTDLNVLLSMRGQARRIAASNTTMGVLLGSAAGLSAISASSVALNQMLARTSSTNLLLASTSLMTTVWANDSSTNILLGSTVNRNLVYNSDTALAALQANPAQVDRLISTIAVNKNSNESIYTFEPMGNRVILLRRYYDDADYDQLAWGRGITFESNGYGPAASTGRQLYLTNDYAHASNSGTYTANGSYATVNNVTCNFVSPANGLKRCGSVAGGPMLYVSYIRV